MENRPALRMGLAILFGAALNHSLVFVIPILWLLFHVPYRLPIIVLMTASLFYAMEFQNPSEGVFYFHPTGKQRFDSPFGKSTGYRGELKDQSLRCTIFPKKKFSLDKDYLIPGKVFRDESRWIFKPDRKSRWKSIPQSFSLATWREKVKSLAVKSLKKHCSSKESFSLLSALATGEVQDQKLASAFEKVGLGHLLAISGFHFGWISFILLFLFRPIFSHKWVSSILLIALTLFMGFVGPSPSIQRTWIALVLFLIAKLGNLTIDPLNFLGSALGISILLDPSSITSIGFQLSYLATFCIFLFHIVGRAVANDLFPAKTPYQVAKMALADQIIFLISRGLKKVIGINLAVQLPLIPLLLFHFHTFPLASLLYNLFIPFLLIPTLIGLIFAPLIPSITWINSLYTHEILQWVMHPPPALTASIIYRDMSAEVAILSTFAILLLGKKLANSLQCALLCGGRSSVG